MFQVQESELRAEKLISTSSDGSLTVFMSAVANPDRFWVQVSPILITVSIVN